MSARGVAQDRAALAERLRERAGELEEALLARVGALASSEQTRDPEYLAGLRGAVVAGIGYGLAAIESSASNPPQIPPQLLVQARLAARNGVSLDTVLRRYFAGYALLADFLLEETEEGGLLEGVGLKGLLRTQAPLFDRLLEAVAEEHGRELERRANLDAERRTDLVRRLLAGERLEATELGYRLEGWHLGLVATGDVAMEMLRDLASALDRDLLSVCRPEQVVWGWLGGRERLDPVEVERLLRARDPDRFAVAIGEPGEGLAGWRITHRQATAALVAVKRGRPSPVRYADVALLNTVIENELLAISLRDLYLEPLADRPSGGKTLRETLRAYLACGCTTSAAAAALGVNRHTVSNRLRIVERRLGRPLVSCATELDIALRLDEEQ